MKKSKNNSTQNPKFNIYWIYGIIITFLLGMSFFGGDSNYNAVKTNISEFERYLNANDVSEVIVINQNLANVSLKKESLTKPEHQRIR